MVFTSFEVKIAFNIFNQDLKEKLGLSRDKAETGAARSSLTESTDAK